MEQHYQIAIVGSGPAGLSAASRAAARGVSHVLLEKTDHLSDTIYKYQKGKLVMATPDVLPLRSDISFAYGSREEVLTTWDDQTCAVGANVEFNAEVNAIQRNDDGFEITLGDGRMVAANQVVMAIGLQGNIRRLDVPGAATASHLQYQLDDPEEYAGETIVVVGAGDAGIENAVALAKQNKVILLNRRGEFSRIKDGNLSLILDCIEKGILSCLYNAHPVGVAPGSITVATQDGEVDIECDRIVARLGAIAPRKFVEACGIVFPSESPTALPEVSATYESNVPGLYIIGALGGYPLIKQAMNQGYEVIEFILGNDIKPADEPLLLERFKVLGDVSVEEVFALIRDNVPIFSALPALVLRELLLDATIHRPASGETIFRRNDYTNSFYAVVQGNVAIEVDPEDPSHVITLDQGEFFGEMGLIAGRRRTATVRAGEDTILIEVPRRLMLKVLASFDGVKDVFDRVAVLRQIQTYITPSISQDDLAGILDSVSINYFKQGEVLFKEGDAGTQMHLIRRGSVTVSQQIAGKEVILSYVPAGNYVGEMALISGAPRSATVRATVPTETVEIDGAAFKELLERKPDLRRLVERKFRDRLAQNERMRMAGEAGNIIQFLIAQGAGEATDILLIDESLCVRCNNCEAACAATHGGISRLDREAGPTVANLHVPTSCRHCENPYCMTDCPPDAIHRSSNGEVYIDDSCIGCGNCERNCPYNVIQLASLPRARRKGTLSWLLLGSSSRPETGVASKSDAPKLAVKCDMCKDIEGGAACVRSCPTGAAIRVNPEQFLSLTELASQ